MQHADQLSLSSLHQAFFWNYIFMIFVVCLDEGGGASRISRGGVGEYFWVIDGTGLWLGEKPTFRRDL